MDTHLLSSPREGSMTAYSQIMFAESTDKNCDNDCILQPVDPSVAAYKLVVDFMQNVFNTQLLIHGFFPKELCAKFQLLQHQTGLIVSGSTGLGFFTQTLFPGADLDLFIRVCFRTIVDDFLKKAGYSGGRKLGHQSALTPLMVDTIAGMETYSANAIASIYEYHNSDTRKFQVIFCTQSPIDVLLSFHSTAPMNFVVHDVAVSLYPRATFNMGVNFKRTDERTPAVAGQHKYANCGWVPVNACDANEDAHLQDVERFIDTNSVMGHSWTLSYLEGDKGWTSQYSVLQRQFPYAPLCVSDHIAHCITDDLLECSDSHLPLAIASIIGDKSVHNFHHDAVTALESSMASCTVKSKDEALAKGMYEFADTSHPILPARCIPTVVVNFSSEGSALPSGDEVLAEGAYEFANTSHPILPAHRIPAVVVNFSSEDEVLAEGAYKFADTSRQILPVCRIPTIVVNFGSEGSVPPSNSAKVEDCKGALREPEGVKEYYNFADTPRHVIPI
ncbi:uncharacterized protein ARMOST_20956 [Armillaria ostoyae]|uniref:Uncharacterized protein n=1 Tax=Armillaria ostoyae TaxID=47428 RepID=A0A284S8W5_ARMOS|nr:uncharacterized protein ARMOST_20956 [Armillaria ostoyae]